MMWLVITGKELKDAFRDRRALAALLLFPLMGPALIYFMFNMIIDIAEEAGAVTLPVVGVQYAGDLADYLEQNGITLEPVALVTPPEPGSDFYSTDQLAKIRRDIRRDRKSVV